MHNPASGKHQALNRAPAVQTLTSIECACLWPVWAMSPHPLRHTVAEPVPRFTVSTPARSKSAFSAARILPRQQPPARARAAARCRRRLGLLRMASLTRQLPTAGSMLTEYVAHPLALIHNDQYDHTDWNAMITETSAVNFRQNLGEMLSQVQYRHDTVVINKDGKPVAALVDARLFERIRRMQDRFDALCQRIEAGFANAPEAKGFAEIEAAVERERAQARSSAKKR